MNSGELDRRSFLIGSAATGGGLALGIPIPEATTPAAAQGGSPMEITCWLVISPDNRVTIRVARAEMGQGAMTGLAMLVAEELQCDWSAIRTEFVSPRLNLRRGRIWGDLSTGASRSIASSQDYLRRAGATAREMLIAAAAARWKVPASQCSAQNGTITHVPTSRSLTFGAVADDAAKIEPPADVALKPPADWTLAGKPRKRLDVFDKVTGQPIYAIDVRLPGMLYAAIVQCPVFGGTLKSVDDSAVVRMKGVHRVVRMPDAVAVVADSWWRAKTAAAALRVNWDNSGNDAVSSEEISDFVRGVVESSLPLFCPVRPWLCATSVRVWLINPRLARLSEWPRARRAGPGPTHRRPVATTAHPRHLHRRQTALPNNLAPGTFRTSPSPRQPSHRCGS